MDLKLGSDTLKEYPHILASTGQKFQEIKDAYIFDKLDGCFTYGTKILLANGNLERIGTLASRMLCKKESPIIVWTYNELTRTVEQHKIIGAHKYLADKPQLTIKYGLQFWNSSVKKHQKTGHNRITCTSDHRFMTPVGYKPAEELHAGDVIYRFNVELPYLLEQFLTGALLGDSDISIFRNKGRTYGNPKISFCHGEKQLNYLLLKYRLLGEYARPAKPDRRRGGFSNTIRTRFSTKSLAAFGELYVAFIRNGKRCVPYDIENRLTPLAIAVWYMDDGSLVKGHNQQPRASFHTEGFTFPDTKRLLIALNRFNIKGSIANRKNHPVIELDTISSTRLFSLIAPYITPCLSYKVPEEYRVKLGYFDQLPPFKFINGLHPVIVSSVEPHNPGSKSRYHYVYDLTVEGSHSYFANRILVHNSLIRVEWNKKSGFYKFGSKSHLIDKSDPLLGCALDLFMNKYSESLSKLAKDNKWQHFIAFLEAFGPDSFAGTHPSGINSIILFDLDADKKGIIGPKRFLKLTEGIETPKFFGIYNWTRAFVEDIRLHSQHCIIETLYNAKITFEGVVGKSGDGHSLIMAKAKTQQWIDKVRNTFKEKADAILNS